MALATAGPLTADIVTYSSLSSFLLQRVDSQLESDAQGAENNGFTNSGGKGSTGADLVEVCSPSGKVLFVTPVPHVAGTTPPPGPSLPTHFTIPSMPNDGPDRVTYLTVPAMSGGGGWTVRASIDGGAPDTFILATSLSSVTGTLHRLFLVELFVTLGVVALGVLTGLVLLGLWIVRLGLRPLVAIGRTAALITKGDLSPTASNGQSPVPKSGSSAWRSTRCLTASRQETHVCAGLSRTPRTNSALHSPPSAPTRSSLNAGLTNAPKTSRGQ